MSKQHQKHAKLAKPSGGAWGRTELALLGAPCEVIRAVAQKVAAHFEVKWHIGFADADHHPAERDLGAVALYLTDHGSWQQIDVANRTAFSQCALFNACNLVLVNGNHFDAQQQVLVIHPGKSLASKLENLRDVQLIVLAEEGLAVPDYLQVIAQSVPVICLKDEEALIEFFEGYLVKHTPVLNGLVLAGGQSLRMGSDKSLLQYHDKPQRAHLFEMLQPLCEETFISCNAIQAAQIDLPSIEDKFLGIGPMGGILSAFQSAPNAAWLVVATDLPYLNTNTLNYLIAHRDPSRLATAFIGTDGLLEPLITIWEPRAYPVLLQALSMGLSCPRKILTSCNTMKLDPPGLAEVQNVNLPAERDAAMQAIKKDSIPYSV